MEVIIEDSGRENAFFTESARNLLEGCLIYEYVVNGKSFIQSMQTLLKSDLTTYVGQIKEDLDCPKKVLMLLAEFGREGDTSNATEDIKKTLKQQTAVFTRSDTEWFLDPTVNPRMCHPALLDEHVSLFLSIQRADLKRYGVLFRLIITQCSTYLSRREDDDSTKPPVIIIVDEFTNLGGRIPDYTENLGFIRAKKVFFTTIFQQYSQVEALYGKEEARTILNMGHQLILSCEDPELGKIFSEKAGSFLERKYSVRKQGLFGVTGNDSTVSMEHAKRVRVMDDLVSLYPRFESIAFINGSEYIRFKKCRYYLEKGLRERAETCEAFHRKVS